MQTEKDAREAQVNQTIKQVLAEMEVAARQEPVDACEPYAVEKRRKVVIRAIWELYRRLSGGD